MGFSSDKPRPRRSLAWFLMLSLLLSALLPFGLPAGGRDVRAEEAEALPTALTNHSITHLALRADNAQGTATLHLAKVSAADKAPLAGAEFTLRDIASGAAWAVDTDLDGRAAFVGLPPGSYALSETRAPEGYAPDPARYTIEIGIQDGEILADVYGTITDAEGAEERIKLTRTIAVHLDLSGLTGEDAEAERAKLRENLDVTLSLLHAQAVDYSKFNDIPKQFNQENRLLFSGISTTARKAQILLSWDETAPEERNISKGYRFEIFAADAPEPDADHSFRVRVTALEASEASRQNDYSFDILSFIVGPEEDEAEAEEEVPFEERFADLDPDIVQIYALYDRETLETEIDRVRDLRDAAREKLETLRSETATRRRLELEAAIAEIPDKIATLEAEVQELLNREDGGGGGVDVEVGDIVLDDTGTEDDIIIVDGEGESEDTTSEPADTAPDIVIEEGESEPETPVDTPAETEALPGSEDPAVRELQTEIAELDAELAAKREALADFTEELATAEAEHADCVLRLELLRYHVERLTEERLAAEAEAAEEEHAATDAIDIPAAADTGLPAAEPDDSVEEVEAKLALAQAEKDNTLKDIKRAKDDIHDLFDELDEILEELEQAEAELAELTQSEADGGGGEDIDLTVGDDATETSGVDSEKEIAIKRLEAAIAELNDRRQDVLIRIAGSTANIADFEAKLRAFDGAIAGLRERRAFLLRPSSIVAHSEALDIGDGKTVLAATVGTPPPGDEIAIYMDVIWQTEDEAPFNVKLYRTDKDDNRDELGAVSLFPNEDGTWKQFVSMQARYANDDAQNPWAYGVEEQNWASLRMAGFESEYAQDENGSDMILITITVTDREAVATGSEPENIQLNLRKVWEPGDRSNVELPAQVQFTVKQTASTGATRDLGPYTLTADDAILGNKYTWEIAVPNLKFKDDDGTTYSYEVTEDVPAGYEAVVEKSEPQNGEQTFTVTNTKKQDTEQRRIEIVLQKTWQLVKADSKISGKITFTLKRKDDAGNTEDVGDFSLSEDDGDKTGTVRIWTKSLGTFDYWPDPADHGKGNYTYFVKERSIAGFDSTVENPVWDNAAGKLTLKVKNTQDGYEEPQEPTPTTTDEDGTVTTTIPGTGETRSLWIPLGLATLAALVLFFRRQTR